MKKKTIIKMGLTPSQAPFRICNIRTFLYIYVILLSKYYNLEECQLIFQIDDTNPNKRIHSNDEIISFYEKIGIINKFLPITIVSQSDNQKLYDHYYNQLLNMGYITIREDGVSCFNVEKYKSNYGEKIILKDAISGPITFNVSSLTTNDMFAIKRSNGTYLYHFAACIDNLHLGLTHIIRGKNKISSAAYQLIINNCLGFNCPTFIHMPLLTSSDTKNSEINNRSLLMDLLNIGYDIYPIFSYLLSSGYGDSNEIYSSIDEFAKKLNIMKFHKHDGKFDINILNKINKKFYNQVSYDDYVTNIMITSSIISDTPETLDEDILKIGYKHHLSYKNIIDIIRLISNDSLEKIKDNEKDILDKIIPILVSEQNINIVVEQLSQYSKKEIYELIRYFYIGTKKGYSCSAIKDIFEHMSSYQNRINLVHKKVFIRE